MDRHRARASRNDRLLHECVQRQADGNLGLPPAVNPNSVELIATERRGMREVEQPKVGPGGARQSTNGRKTAAGSPTGVAKRNQLVAGESKNKGDELVIQNHLAFGLFESGATGGFKRGGSRKKRIICESVGLTHRRMCHRSNVRYTGDGNRRNMYQYSLISIISFTSPSLKNPTTPLIPTTISRPN